MASVHLDNKSSFFSAMVFFLEHIFIKHDFFIFSSFWRNEKIMHPHKRDQIFHQTLENDVV